MFVIDVITLLERIARIEQENKDLRALVDKHREELSNELDATQQSVYEQIPTLTADGKLLRVETTDSGGNKVYAHVVVAETVAAEE